MQQSDPRFPIIIGMIVLAVLALGGIIWAVTMAPSGGDGRFDPNVSFVDEGDPVYGNSDASVSIRIFEDFQCPACAVASEGVRYVRETYGDRVRIVWNDFVLSYHSNALLAANAARCAEEQGKFWEYGDVLYGSQKLWEGLDDPAESFIAYAKGLDMNQAAFSACLDERRYNEKIQNDIQEARANRVDSTPTFFINNKRYAGVYSPAQWDEMLKPFLGEGEASAPPPAQPMLDLEAESVFQTPTSSEED